jgi:hypothetical protein
LVDPTNQSTHTHTPFVTVCVGQEIVARGLKHRLLADLRACILPKSAPLVRSASLPSGSVVSGGLAVLSFMTERRSPQSVVSVSLNHITGSVGSVGAMDPHFWPSVLSTIGTYFGSGAVDREDVATVQASDALLRDVVHMLLERCGVTLQPVTQQALAVRAQRFLFTPSDIAAVGPRVRASARDEFAGLCMCDWVDVGGAVRENRLRVNPDSMASHPLLQSTAGPQPDAPPPPPCAL